MLSVLTFPDEVRPCLLAWHRLTIFADWICLGEWLHFANQSHSDDCRTNRGGGCLHYMLWFVHLPSPWCHIEPTVFDPQARYSGLLFVMYARVVCDAHRFILIGSLDALPLVCLNPKICVWWTDPAWSKWGVLSYLVLQRWFSYCSRLM